MKKMLGILTILIIFVACGDNITDVDINVCTTTDGFVVEGDLGCPEP